MPYRIQTNHAEINSLDLSPIIERMTGEQDPKTGCLGWPLSVVEVLAEQYRAFLYLVWKHPEERIVPFRELDEFWHNHILFTEKYTEDCLKIFGKYIHHYPHKQKSAEDITFYRTQYSRTLELLKKEFPNVQ